MWGNTSRGTDQDFYENRLKNRRKKILKLLAVSITIIIILGICGSVVYNAGYIPMKRFMEVKEPIGEAKEIDINEHLDKYPEIKNLPYYDKLKYRLYGTNQSLDAVANDYKEKLENEGYKILIEGVAYKDEIPFKYYGFIKGITGVGIIITSDKNVTQDYETMVLYTTGNAVDYRNILKWYKENDDVIADIYS
jgi:hypothetical protein